MPPFRARFFALLPLFEITSSGVDTGVRCAGTTDDYSGKFEYITQAVGRYHGRYEISRPIKDADGFGKEDLSGSFRVRKAREI